MQFFFNNQPMRTWTFHISVKVWVEHYNIVRKGLKIVNILHIIMS